MSCLEAFVAIILVAIIFKKILNMSFRLCSILTVVCFFYVAVLTKAEQYNNTVVSNEQRTLRSRIVGGILAKAGEFPSFAIGPGCGATLIHSDILLTAAHCSGTFKGSTIRIGGIKRGGSDSEKIKAITEIQHPLYKSSVSYSNDIMIVVLGNQSKAPVQILNSNATLPVDGDILTIAGFGKTSESFFNFYNGNLRRATVPKVSFSSCRRSVGQFSVVVDATMICAGGGKRDTCQGDSGGPIIASNGAQVGITSFGIGCARSGFPGVYTRISNYTSWITQTICDYSKNKPSSC